MNALWLSGKSNMDLGFLATSASKRPMLPQTGDRTLAIPGMNGAYDFGADLGIRSFSYDCRIIATDYLELQQRVIQIASYLLDTHGKPRQHVMRQAERPGQSILVRYSGSMEDIQRIMGTGIFTLPLIAHDPFFYANEQLHEEVVSASPEVIQIESTGNIRTMPYIVLTNQGTNIINRIRLVNEFRIE